MPTDPTAEELLSLLNQVGAAVDAKFKTADDRHMARLYQFESHMATTKMALEFLYDEAERG
jgi:hypothetical protein